MLHTQHDQDTAPATGLHINAYHNNEEIIKHVIDKIMGESEFKGKPNDPVWTGK
jgi:hypothetical protein